MPENAGNFSKKIGRYFTFVKFLETLVKCAKMTFSGYSTGSESQIYQGYKINQELLESEMVCLLLERMELSKGFNTLEQRTNRPHTAQITLLPNKQVIRSLNAAKAFLQNQEEEMRSSQQSRPQQISPRREPQRRTTRPLSPGIPQRTSEIRSMSPR